MTLCDCCAPQRAESTSPCRNRNALTLCDSPGSVPVPEPLGATPWATPLAWRATCQSCGDHFSTSNYGGQDGWIGQSIQHGRDVSVREILAGQLASDLLAEIPELGIGQADLVLFGSDLVLLSLSSRHRGSFDGLYGPVLSAICGVTGISPRCARRSRA